MTVTLQKLLNSNTIPSLPEVAAKVVRIAQQPEPDFDELIQVIRADPAISARILKTVNSALFGLRQRVSSIETAIPILGATLIRTLVLSFSLADYRGGLAKYRVYFQRLWRGCVTQAVAAETLASRNPELDATIWFMAGLLQDIGRLALLSNAPEESSRLIGLVDDGPELLEAERRDFGFTHVDVSVQLCLRWRIDETLVDAIARHHVWLAKDSVQVNCQPADAQIGNALRCAAMIADYLEGLRSSRSVDRQLLENALQGTYGVNAEELDELLTEIDHRVAEIAALFMFDIGEFTAFEDLLAEAHATLAELAVASQIEATNAKRHIEEAQAELANVRSESEELREQAQRDALTGALTRRYLEPTLAEELDRCRRHGRRLGILFMDVDKFKTLNDTHGHALGDDVLRSLVQVLRESLRDTDHIVRYGGDEFVVIVNLAMNSTLSRVAERVRGQIESLRLEAHPQVRFSSSIGALLYQPGAQALASCEQLIDEADHAMYVAKQRGGNQVALFTLNGPNVTAIEVEYRHKPVLTREDVWASEAPVTSG